MIIIFIKRGRVLLWITRFPTNNIDFKCQDFYPFCVRICQDLGSQKKRSHPEYWVYLNITRNPFNHMEEAAYC